MAAEAVSVAVVLVVVAAEVLAEVAPVAVALAELLTSQAVLKGFTRRVRAELLELEHAEAELGSVWAGILHICQRRRRRFALQTPGGRGTRAFAQRPIDVRLLQ